MSSWAYAKEMAKQHTGLLNLQTKKPKTEHTNHIKYYAHSRSSPFSLNYHINAKHVRRLLEFWLTHCPACDKPHFMCSCKITCDYFRFKTIFNQLIKINLQQSFISSSSHFSFRGTGELTKIRGKCRKTRCCGCDLFQSLTFHSKCQRIHFLVPIFYNILSAFRSLQTLQSFPLAFVPCRWAPDDHPLKTLTQITKSNMFNMQMFLIRKWK